MIVTDKELLWKIYIEHPSGWRRVSRSDPSCCRATVDVGVERAQCRLLYGHDGFHIGSFWPLDGDAYRSLGSLIYDVAWGVG